MRANILNGVIALAALAFLARSVPTSAADEPSAGKENRVTFVVSVPTDDAELQVQGAVTKTTGKVRRLTSPPLPVGKTFTYEFKVTWKVDGQTRSKEALLKVESGHTVEVDLTPSTEVTSKTPAPKKEPETPKPVEPKKEVEAKKEPTPKKEPEPVKPVESKKDVEVKKEPKKEPETPKPVEPKKEVEVRKEPTPALPPVKEPEKVTKKEPEPKTGEAPAKVPEPKKEPAGKAELGLTMPSQLTVTAGGYTKILPIHVKRDGFEGPITLKFDKLPLGVTMADATIPPGADEANVEAVVAADAPSAETEVKVLAESEKAKSEFSLKVKVSGK